MGKKWLAALLVLGLAFGVGISGCSTGGGDSGSSLPEGVSPGGTISSPEATLTGAVDVSSAGDVDINLGGVIPTGTTEAVTVALDRMKVYVAEGSVASAADLNSSSISWTELSLTFRDTSDTPMDIVHILDNTGSMGGEITDVKNSIINWANTIEAAGYDAQHALITYGDEAAHPTTGRPIQNLSTAASLETTLAGVSATGGADGPENPLDCVKWALGEATTTAASAVDDNISYRSGAQKIFIIYTDINGHQNVPADVSSNNYCTTTMTTEITRVRSNNVKVYAVSPNYTTSQWPYCDVRKLADGFGEGRTAAEAALYSSGGAWMNLPTTGGDVDLSDLGIASSLTAGRVVRIGGFTFVSGTTYTIVVYYDVDGDGILDSYAFFVFVYSGSGSSSASVAPAAADAALPAADGIDQPN